MCGGNRDGPKWKREFVQEHKFDYVDIDEFYDPSCSTRIGYVFLFLLVFKSFLVYVADLWTGVSLLVVGNSSANADAAIPADVSKWIFLGAILISFFLLFWDIRKSRGIIASRDISYAFTSVIVNRYYSMKDYKYYCLFCKINRSRKWIDDVAFFVFFTLKGWKRLLLAEAPRQVINVVTLKVMIPQWINIKEGSLQLNSESLGKTVMQKIMTGTMAFSCLMFAFAFFLVCIAAILYIPLLCHIQGNLKEYCCHKVDKRIAEILRKQARKRIAYAQKGGKKTIKKQQSIEMEEFPKPTLPIVGMDDGRQSPSLRSQNWQYYPDNGTMMSSRFGRRNSGSSVNSDQAGLTAHAQAQPWSSPTPQPYGSHYPFQSSPALQHATPQPYGQYHTQGYTSRGSPYQYQGHHTFNY